MLEAIYRRRSIREFTEEAVLPEQLYEIVKAGTWAPSGLNNQPWRFVIVQDHGIRDELARLTRYRHIVEAAAALVAVYLDRSAMYDAVKDQQSAGACIQNMLLAAEALGLGTVWLGQILQNKMAVNRVFGLGEDLDLMAVIAIGHPLHRRQTSTRRGLQDFILKEF